MRSTEHTEFSAQGASARCVFVDGNNVMGARPDGWWRDRRAAERRLVGEIGAVARACGGVWTMVFDGRAPGDAAPAPANLEVVYTGHGRRDGADDQIVAQVAELARGADALVYTSDARLRARVVRLGGGWQAHGRCSRVAPRWRGPTPRRPVERARARPGAAVSKLAAVSRKRSPVMPEPIFMRTFADFGPDYGWFAYCQSCFRQHNLSAEDIAQRIGLDVEVLTVRKRLRCGACGARNALLYCYYRGNAARPGDPSPFAHLLAPLLRDT